MNNIEVLRTDFHGNLANYVVKSRFIWFNINGMIDSGCFRQNMPDIVNKMQLPETIATRTHIFPYL